MTRIFDVKNRGEIIKILSAAPTSVLCSAHQMVHAMHGAIAPLYDGARLFGPAKTVKIKPGENAAIHRAVHTAERGDVLVVEAGADQHSGPFGELLATSCLRREIAGLVIDGTVRDVEDIRRLEFPVFCLGACPAQTSKALTGDIDVKITCAGASVSPGDYVVGDADGVVIVPKEIAHAVATRTLEVMHMEAAIKARIEKGETTFEIFDIHNAQERGT